MFYFHIVKIFFLFFIVFVPWIILFILRYFLNYNTDNIILIYYFPMLVYKFDVFILIKVHKENIVKVFAILYVLTNILI